MEPPPVAPDQEIASAGGAMMDMFRQPVAPPAPRRNRAEGPLARGGEAVGARAGIWPLFAPGRSPTACIPDPGARRPADDDTDYYPVALKEETLRPGTVYADPYGHLLVLAKRVAQSGGEAGVFLAVDGQPDGTVARKRFWRGNFLFAQDPALGGPGFKHFRPVVRDKNGALRRLTNAEIAKDPQYGDFSLEQARLEIEDFYDRMDDLMSPAPLDPLRAMKEAITSLEEQVKTRVTSVENGRKFQSSGAATRRCRTARRSSRPPARGRISRRRRAICAC